MAPEIENPLVNWKSVVGPRYVSENHLLFDFKIAVCFRKINWLFDF